MVTRLFMMESFVSLFLEKLGFLPVYLFVKCFVYCSLKTLNFPDVFGNDFPKNENSCKLDHMSVSRV